MLSSMLVKMLFLQVAALLQMLNMVYIHSTKCGWHNCDKIRGFYYQFTSVDKYMLSEKRHDVWLNYTAGNGKIGHVNQANNMYLFPG